MDRPVMTPEGVRAAVRDAVVMCVQDHTVEGPQRSVPIRIYGSQHPYRPRRCCIFMVEVGLPAILIPMTASVGSCANGPGARWWP